MKLILVHISDSHLKADAPFIESELSTRIPALAQSVAGITMAPSKLALVFSGDLAFSGKAAEYEQVKHLYSALDKQLEGPHKLDIAISVAVPGNHDCDFSGDQESRSYVLSHDPTNGISGSVENSLLSPQAAFVDFSEKSGVLRETKTATTSGIASAFKFDWDGETLEFLLFNTATYSTKEERPGNLRMPVSQYEPSALEPGSRGVSIAVFHHPLNWLHPDDARAFRSYLAKNVDLVLTGHDHESENWGRQTTRDGKQVYVEAGILWDEDAGASAFGVIEIDTRESIAKIHNLVWDSDNQSFLEFRTDEIDYSRKETGPVHLIDQPSALSFLDDPGAAFEHPRKSPLALEDVFVFPDIQKGTVADSGAAFLGESSIVEFLAEHSPSLIIGDEKSGKSGLAKRLVRMFEAAQFMPLLFCEEFTKIPEGKPRIEKINEVIGRYYSSDPGLFWRIPIDRRVAIVDDFDRTRGGSRQNRVAFIDFIRDKFGVLVVLASSAERLEEIARLTTGDWTFEEFERLRILEFGHRKRAGLIRKWVDLGQEVPLDKDVAARELHYRERVISEVLGRHLFPSIPFFVLILLQQLDVGHGVSTTVTSTYGHLYESLIKRNLSTVADGGSDLDERINYLSHLAYFLYRKGVRSISYDELRTWHAAYVARFDSTYSLDRAMNEMARIRMWKQNENHLRFRYRYSFQFFVAKFLADNIESDEVRDVVHNAFSNLHLRDSGNIVMFLGHLSKNPQIVRELQDVASRLFPDIPVFDLAERPGVLRGDTTDSRRVLRLRATDPDRNREEIRAAMDQMERSLPEDQDEEDEVDVEIEDPDANDLLGFLRDVNASFRTVQMCGQVLRNYYGTIESEPKANLTECAYSLGMKFTSAVLGYLDEHYEEFIEAITGYVSQRDADDDPLKIAETVNKEVFAICQFIVIAGVGHVARSLALDRLEPTFDRVISEHESQVSYELIDVAVRLGDPNKFPLTQVKAFAKKHNRNLMAFELLRRLVWHDLHVMHRKPETIQAACAVLDIKTPTSGTLQGPRKKLPRGRGKDGPTR